MQTASATLWRNNNFITFWAGQTISLFGTHISYLAIPLVAATQLQASPTQMGVMQMAQFLPFLLFGLLAGAFVDRLPRKSVMIVADLGRAAAFAVIPLAAYRSWLGMEVLYIVVFVVGIFNLLFEAAYSAFLPKIVARDQLSDSNSKLHASAAAAEIAGPGLGGWLVQVATAAFAVIADAISFVVSGMFLMSIKVEEQISATDARRSSILRDITEGLKALIENKYIRPMVFCSATANIFISMFQAIYVLYLTRDLNFTPAQIGAMFMLGSIGGLLGALYVGPLTRWMGVGRAILAECIIVGLASTAIPFVSLLGAKAFLVIAFMHALWGFGFPLYIVNSASLRQLTTPEHLLGRVTASSRFISWGAASIGYLIGGLVAESIGLFPTMVIAGLGLLAASLWVIFSPVVSLKEIPHIAHPTS